MANLILNENIPDTHLIHPLEAISVGGSDFSFRVSTNADTYSYLGNGTTTGSTASFIIDVPAGRYELWCQVRQGTGCGIMTWYVDDVPKGVINCYYASTVYNAWKQLLEGIFITDPVTLSLKAGKHTLKILCDSKDESSSNYTIGLYSIKLVRTGDLTTGNIELNEMLSSGIVHSIECIATPGRVTTNDSSQHFYTAFSPTAAAGNYLTKEIAVAPGKYVITNYFTKANDCGIFDMYIDNVKVIENYDTYSSATQYNVSVATDIVQLSGNHTLKWEIVGKHASSSSYKLLFLFARIVRADNEADPVYVIAKKFIKNSFLPFPKLQFFAFATCSKKRAFSNTAIGWAYDSGFTVFTSSDYLETQFYSGAGTFDMHFYYRGDSALVPYWEAFIDGASVGTFTTTKTAGAKLSTIANVTISKGLHTLKMMAPTAGTTYKYESLICVYFSRV